ncbi:MAG: hypothetical protein EOO69_11035 [Moraxellaceae bacterium]|nr:MAG: hypothetical protein EOO69_11035 [Moraxellaceae bacterium]
MYAPNSALLNALAHHKINFKQVLKFIESRYDFEPTAFQNGAQKNAAGENQGSCKVFCFAHLNNFDQLDTLALFAEHYQAVKDNPDGTDHQNIRQFIHHGWAGIHFEGHALTPKVNIDAINAQAAQLYDNGGSEFEQMATAETITQHAQPETENEIEQATAQGHGDAQPGATPQPNETSDKLSENMQNFAEPSAPKNADGSVDQQSGSTDAALSSESISSDSMPHTAIPMAAVPSTATTVEHDTLTDNALVDEKLDEARLDEKAQQAILAAEAVKQPVIPPSPGSSNSMVSETTYYTDNDSVTDHTAQHIDAIPEATDPQTDTVDHTGATSMTDPTSLPENNHDNINNHVSGNLSATELATANDQHIADNPAAFIDDSLDTAPNGAATNSPVSNDAADDPVSAAPDQQPVPQSQSNNSTGNSNIPSTSNASGSASASASDIVESNANHIADNPAEFIDEKNTSTNASEPATTDQHTAGTPKKADGDKPSP